MRVASGNQEDSWLIEWNCVVVFTALSCFPRWLSGSVVCVNTGNTLLHDLVEVEQIHEIPNRRAVERDIGIAHVSDRVG